MNKSYDPLSFVTRKAQLQSCLDILMRKRPKNAKHSVLDEPIAMFELLIRQEDQRPEVDDWITCKVCGASTTDRRSMHYTTEYALCNGCCNCFDDGVCKAWQEEEEGGDKSEASSTQA